VRDQHRVVELQQAGVDRRLVLEHVQRRAGDRPGAQRVRQRLLVDDRATSGVDQIGVGAHQRQAAGVDQMAGLRRQRAVDADHR
jgi:hypothetical protein